MEGDHTRSVTCLLDNREDPGFRSIISVRADTLDCAIVSQAVQKGNSMGSGDSSGRGEGRCEALGGTYQINLLFRLIGPEGPHEAKERILRGLRN